MASSTKCLPGHTHGPAVERPSPLARFSEKVNRSLALRAAAIVVVGIVATGALYQAAGEWGWLVAATVTSATALLVFLRRKANARVLDDRGELIQQVSDAIPGMVYQCRLYPSGRCALVYANDAISWIYEKDLRDVEYDCSSILDLVHPDDRPRIERTLLDSALHLTPWKGEYRVILPRQGVRWRMAQARVERLKDGSTLWSGFIVDVTSRKEADESLLLAQRQEAAALRAARTEERKKLKRLARLNKSLRDEASHDHLTGLYVRRYFDRRLAEIFEEARMTRPLTLMFLDIDHFKAYNDTFGHLAGDRCLREVSQALSSQLNRKGQVLARYGGEEFIAILPGLSSDRAGIVAEQLRSAIEALGLPAAAPGKNVTISIGVACMDFVPEGIAETMLLSVADDKLYEAKRHGRNCVRVKIIDLGIDHETLPASACHPKPAPRPLSSFDV